MPEQEEDGWAGEPSEWAEADSFTQKLSAFTQNNLSGFKQFVAEQVAGEFDADAVDGNALVSLCNRYRATEGWIPRTNIHRSRRQEVRTTSARDESKRRSPRSATR